MKKYLQNDICTYHLALSRQFTAQVIVALGSAAIGGLAGLLAPSLLIR